MTITPGGAQEQKGLNEKRALSSRLASENHGESRPVLIIYERVASKIDLFSASSNESLPYKSISFRCEKFGFNLETMGFTVSINFSL